MERAALPVTLIEAEAAAGVLQAPFDGRALALMQGSRRVLGALGLWRLCAGDAAAVWRVLVEDRCSGARIAYDARELGPQPFGYGIENRVLRQRLLAAALERPGITLVAPARLARIERSEGRMSVLLEDGRRLTGRLLVGADGRGSTVRALAGIGLDRWRYAQTALTFALRHRAAGDPQVREYLRPAGPLALLPLRPGLSSVTWIEGEQTAASLLQSAPDELLEALAGQLGAEVAPLEIGGRPTGLSVVRPARAPLRRAARRAGR